jgi:PHD finger-like domain-containing protein 5A
MVKILLTYFLIIIIDDSKGKCVICDSYVRPHVLVRVCDECNYGSFEVRQ